MIGTDLTSVSTFGWYTDTEEYEQDLLTSVSTFGWYGITLDDIINVYPELAFGLIIDRELPLEVHTTQTYRITLIK